MNQTRRHEPKQIAQLLILGSYTALSAGLIGETLLMGWELWAIPMIVGGVLASWFVHLRQRMNLHQRLWIYTVLMMATFFFYGVHPTSAYDMGLLMLLVMLIYTVAGESRLVTFGQITYYVTLAFDLVEMVAAGTVWDSLLISRTALHIVVIFMGGWLARFIIRQWDRLFRESDAQIAALDRTARRMTGFMANLSHELRTPVNAILGMAGVLLDRAQSDEARNDLATIRGAGIRMAAQVTDIMDYSELETGDVTPVSEPYRMDSLFNDLVVLLHPVVPGNLELVIDVDPDIPSALIGDGQKLKRVLYHIVGNGLKYTREGGVYVHATAIRQEYGVNLCFEVIDTGIGMSEAELQRVTQRFYQADSGKAVRSGGLGLGLPIAYGFVRALGGFMMIDSRPGEGSTVRVSIPQRISDPQPCMSVPNRERVNLGGYLNIGKFGHPHVREFYNNMILNVARGLGTPMHRVGSVEDLKKLDGKLALTHLFMGWEEYESAREEVESMASRMVVVVAAPEGCALSAGSHALLMPKPLYGFPIAEALNTDCHTSTDEGRLTFPGIRALVTDDEPMNLSVASGILRKYGMTVDTAPSGPEAIRMADDSDYDIVFMDHMMPGMDGVEAMRHMRHHAERAGKEFPIVALTANALSSAREMFLAEGFDGFVSKPIELPELERVLKRVLPRSAARYVQVDMAEPAPARGDGFDRLEAAGFNTASGLRYCQDDADFYRDMLAQFEGDWREKRAKLDADWRENDLHAYAIAVHSLKSTAKLIGAEALSESARLLEAAAKGGDAAFIAARHDALCIQGDDAAAAIRDCLPANDAKAEDPDVLEFDPEGDDEILEFDPEEV